MNCLDLMMAAGAGMILWVAFQFLNEFRKTGGVRPLVVAVVTLPAALLLLAIAFGKL
ncbi:MAG: hypothetical protein ACLQIB_12170 [Isosphaeraceae bacterium]